MAQISCKYHQTSPASWTCRKCHINFCAGCANPERRQSSPNCPVCGAQLESLGAANLITPFWLRIPKFFAYPAQPSSLLILMFIALFGLLVEVQFVGFVAAVLALVAFITYAFAVLERTARGQLDAPSFPRGDVGGNLLASFRQLLLLFLFALALYATDEYMSPTSYGLMFALVALVLPAATMTLAVEHSLTRALNPVLWARMMARIRFPYLILVGFLLVLMLGSDTLARVVARFLSDSQVTPLLILIFMYFVLITFNMMGYVIYQYHEQLGYALPQTASSTPRLAGALDGASAGMREAEILLQEGKLEEALVTLGRKAKEHPVDFALRDRFHKLLLAANRPEKLQDHGRDYLSRLLIERKSSRAMEVLRDCMDANPQFKPANAEEVYPLATYLKANGEQRLALQLLNRFHSAYPHHRDTPKNYLLAAQLMFEQFNRDDDAAAVLKFVIGHFPDHELTPRLRDYLATVERLSSAGSVTG